MQKPTFILAVLVLFLLSGCDSPSKISASASNADQPRQTDSSATEQSAVAFDGRVLVFTTAPNNEEWRAAGWQIDELSIDTDNQEIPLDCTLHPHAGVVGQWVGGCSGNVRVPTRGAMHIAVMLQGEDGSFQVIQVAPPPAYP